MVGVSYPTGNTAYFCLDRQAIKQTLVRITEPLTDVHTLLEGKTTETSIWQPSHDILNA